MKKQKTMQQNTKSYLNQYLNLHYNKMKKSLLLIIILILISPTVFAYSGNASNIQWRFLPSTGASTHVIGAPGSSFNSGDYPGTNFSDTTGEAHFQAYDLPANLIPPMTSPGQEGGGGGGPGNIQMTYMILTEDKACINKPIKVRIVNSLGQNAEGMAEIFYEKNQRWILQYKLNINGEFTFIPTEETTYKIVFNNIEKTITTKKCEELKKETPFASLVKKEQKEKKWEWPITKEETLSTEQLKLKQSITGRITQAIKSNLKTGITSLVIILIMIVILATYVQRKMKTAIQKTEFLQKKEKKHQRTEDEQLDDLSKEIEKLRKKLGKF